MSLMVGGGGGRQLTLAGRRLATRCVEVDEQGGWGAACMVADVGLVDEGILSTPHMPGSGRQLMARKRLLMRRTRCPPWFVQMTKSVGVVDSLVAAAVVKVGAHATM